MNCNDCINGNIYCEKKEEGYRDCKKVEDRCVNFREKERTIFKPLKIGDIVYKYGEEFRVYYVNYVEQENNHGEVEKYFRFFAEDVTMTNDDIGFYDEDIGKNVYLNRRDSEE